MEVQKHPKGPVNYVAMKGSVITKVLHYFTFFKSSVLHQTIALMLFVIFSVCQSRQDICKSCLIEILYLLNFYLFFYIFLDANSIFAAINLKDQIILKKQNVDQINKDIRSIKNKIFYQDLLQKSQLC